MNATLPLESTTSESAEYRFRYGWRYVSHTLPTGKSETEMVPLTLEDALHPEEGDHYMISDPHFDDCAYLKGVFRAALSGLSGATVLADCRIAWDADGKYAHGPDVAVIFEVAERKLWRTFNVVEEGTRPALIVEITSESTRVNDVQRKVVEYAEVGVPRYVIVDADETNGARTISFIHYQLQDGAFEYQELPISANGRVWLPEVRLWLSSEQGRVACYDAKGQLIADYEALSLEKAREEGARLQAEGRADIAEARAEAAEQAITTEVEARMADLRARKDAERKAVEAERKAAEKDSLVAQLQAELEQFRSGNPTPL